MANEVILTIGLSLVFAFGLDPVVGVLTRRGMGRGKASLLVFFVLFLVVFVLVVWVASPLWHEVEKLVGDIPGYVDKLRDQPVSDNTDIVDKLHSVAVSGAKALPKAASSLLGITGALVGSVLSVVTLVFLTLFLLIGLPDFKRAALAMLPPAQAANVGRVVEDVTKTISYSLIGNQPARSAWGRR